MVVFQRLPEFLLREMAVAHVLEADSLLAGVSLLTGRCEDRGKDLESLRWVVGEHEVPGAQVLLRLSHVTESEVGDSQQCVGVAQRAVKSSLQHWMNLVSANRNYLVPSSKIM